MPATAPRSLSLPAPVWSPDCGDGRYRNPVLHADYSDPDAIREAGDTWTAQYAKAQSALVDTRVKEMTAAGAKFSELSDAERKLSARDWGYNWVDGFRFPVVRK